MSHALWYTNHMMKMNEEQLNTTPHYCVYDYENEESHYFAKSHEGLEAAIELASKLQTWVACFEGQFFLKHRHYSNIWEHQALTESRNNELVQYYKQGHYHGD